MKITRLLLLTIVLLSATSVSAKNVNSKFKSEIEIGSFFTRTSFGASYRAGYSFGNSFFVGGGVGVDYLYKFGLKGGDYSVARFPIFIAAKYALPITGCMNLLIAADGGYRIYTKDLDRNGKPFYVVPKVGVGFNVGKGRSNSLNFYLAYNNDDKRNYLGAFIGFSF